MFSLSDAIAMSDLAYEAEQSAKKRKGRAKKDLEPNLDLEKEIMFYLDKRPHGMSIRDIRNALGTKRVPSKSGNIMEYKDRFTKEEVEDALFNLASMDKVTISGNFVDLGLYRLITLKFIGIGNNKTITVRCEKDADLDSAISGNKEYLCSVHNVSFFVTHIEVIDRGNLEKTIK